MAFVYLHDFLELNQEFGEEFLATLKQIGEVDKTHQRWWFPGCCRFPSSLFSSQRGARLAPCVCTSPSLLFILLFILLVFLFAGHFDQGRKAAERFFRDAPSLSSDEESTRIKECLKVSDRHSHLAPFQLARQ